VAAERGMMNRTLRTALTLLAGLAAFAFAGCSPAQPRSDTTERAKTDDVAEATETQSVAEAVLGKNAEVLAHGDLARNGLEQVFAVNRLANNKPNASGSSSSALWIMRAAIVEKKDGKWIEVLRCDERLKNPYGYLAGSPDGRVSGWRLQYDPNAPQGLEMKFTPADDYADRQASGGNESSVGALLVRWNIKVKRYQSLDQSHERYLSEIPSLETPHSTLR